MMNDKNILYTFSSIHKKNGTLFASVHVDYKNVPDFIIGIADNDLLRVNTRIIMDIFSIAAHAKLVLKRRECGESNMPDSFSVACNVSSGIKAIESATV